MNVLKYVRWENGFFMLFPNVSLYEDVRYPTHEEASSCYKSNPIRSAGFLTIDGATVFCHGESSTLGIGVANDDEEFFRAVLL